MLPLRRSALIALALTLAPQLAAAGPVEWNFKVVDYNPPAPILAQGSGLTDPALVLFTLPRPLTPPVSLPDPTEYHWNTFDANVTTRAHVYLVDMASGQSAWRPVGWGVTQTWKKSADGTEWVFQGEIEGTYRTADNPFEPYLGGNTYQLWVDEDRGVNVKVLEATPPTHLEPEPGSLVLAGMGLAALAVRLRRRAG